MAEPELITTGHSGQLMRVFADTARLLVSQRSSQEVLETITDRAVEHVTGCAYAGITVIHRDGRLDTPVGTHDVVYESDRLQAELGEGPCHDAIRQQATFRVDEMADETRWPAYARQAAALGLGSALGFQLYTHEDTLGALNLYATRPYAFDENCVEVGTVFAAYAAIALAWSRTEDQLRHAMHSREEIGNAVGVLMERHHLTADQAFATLRQASNEHNLKLRDVADHVARTGEQPSTRDRPTF